MGADFLFSVVILTYPTGGVEPPPAWNCCLFTSFSLSFWNPPTEKLKAIADAIARFGGQGAIHWSGSWRYLYDFHSKAYCLRQVRKRLPCQFSDSAFRYFLINGCLLWSGSGGLLRWFRVVQRGSTREKHIGWLIFGPLWISITLVAMLLPSLVVQALKLLLSGNLQYQWASCLGRLWWIPMCAASFWFRS